MATLSLKNINKIYDNNVQAVFDFNLEIKDKEFIVLVGPSGCGKSTTLRMIAGLEDITYGELCIDGQIMNNVAPKDRNIAMVFQNYALYPHMTVYKNMEFALKLRKQNLPIYEENPEIDELSSQLKLIFKEINKVDRKYKKDQNNKDLLDQHIALYKEVFAIDDKINSLRKPIIGTDTLSIKLLNKKIKEFKKEINFINKQITKGKNLSNDQLDVLKGGVKQREYLIEDLNKQVEYYQNNNSEILKSRHLTKQEMNIDINRTAEAIDLTRYLFRKPSALSGGQRQRVALGRAIVRKPKVFLMDEPLSNLDAKLRVQTRSEISKLHKRVGATTIYVTHDQTEAMTMADRIVIMKDGYVQQVGTPNELYNDPTNKFVAGFIGSPSMNFIQGKFEKDNFIFDNGSNYIKVKKGLQNKVGDLFLGIRPEDIYLKGDINNTKPSNPIKVKVTFTELLGAQLVVYGEVDGQSILFEVKASEKIKIDDILNVCFDLDKMYFFNKDNEERVR